MLNRCRGGLSNTKERVQSIITSADDCWDDRARSLKTDASPVQSKQNLLVEFQSNSSTGVDDESCPDYVINQEHISYPTV